MTNRFSDLRNYDSDDENIDEPYNPMEYLTPQYSYQQIISFFSKNIQAPPELTKIEQVYVRDALSPESTSIPAPSGNINSGIDNSKLPIISLSSQKSPKQQPKGNKKGHQNKPNDDKSESDSKEDLGPLWYYQDPMGVTIGPYSSNKMRDWLNRKWIDSSLLIKEANSDSKFFPISVVFPEISQAFTVNPQIMPGDYSCERGNSERKLTTLACFDIEEKEDELAANWAQTE